jgi:hypothetical protein
MKYLVHFRPGQELSDLIFLQNNSDTPGIGYHCTVASLYVNECQEKKFVAELKKIHFPPFEAVTRKFATRIDQRVYLELSLPPELERLHLDVMRLSRQYAEFKDDFDLKSKQYFFHNYSPHITVSKKGNLFDTASEDAKLLLDQKIYVVELVVSREKTGNWQDVGKLHSNALYP